MYGVAWTGSVARCLDASPADGTLASGHADGGVRFWDARAGERAADVPGLHAGTGGVAGVAYDPTNGTRLATLGEGDRSVRLVDMRMCTAVGRYSHVQFGTAAGAGALAFSADGRYVLAGSGGGELFAWDVLQGGEEVVAERIAGGHGGVGVGAIDWGRGRANGQQVASADRKGTLVLWA